jgi:alpha-amylase
MLHLLLVIHNHQPLGNLPEVFRKAWERAYKPFLEVVLKHPRVKWALHVSGPLWEWFESEEPGYLDILRGELEAGRLELLTGGMWEPIQPIIDERSCMLQFREMREFLRSRFRVEPSGSWTTERVWEPFLADRLARAGARYTLLDDSQLRAGLPSPGNHEVWGYYRTEHDGRGLAVFPIDERLRYLIPFRRAEEVIGSLEDRARSLPDGAAITYGDDGEKFGLWPKTYKWVYEEGWLEDFFTRLEASESITTTHPSEYMRLQPHPRQRVYVPTSSYREMGIWTLYPERNLAAEEIHKWVESNEGIRRVEPPHAAGFFRTYLARYPESRFMQERTEELIRRILDAEPGILPSGSPGASPRERALWHLLRAQCNCAYWHGVFGGLYLNYLRFAIHREILQAEKILTDGKEGMKGVRFIGTRSAGRRPGAEQREVRTGDLVPDPENEILLGTPLTHWAVDPVTGQVVSAGNLSRAVDAIDVIARRFEAYHATMKETSGASAGEIASIHDLQEVAPQGWDKGFGYDPCRRGCFGDRIVREIPPVDSLARAMFSQEIGLDSRPWNVKLSENTIELKRTDGPWTRVKVFTPDPNGSTLRMRYSVSRADKSTFVGHNLIEFNVGLLAGNASDRYHLLTTGERLPLNDKFEAKGVAESVVVDEWTGLRVRLEAPGAEWMAVYPVRTLSRGEGGLEMNYQGSAILFSLPLLIDDSRTWSCEVTMSLYEFP